MVADEMIISITRYVRVALRVAGSAILLYSFYEQKAPKEQAVEAARMTEYSENMTIVMSQNGQRSYRFEAPLLEGYTLGSEPYREFRRGIKITTYQEDSMAMVDAVLTANYAIYYEKRELWEAKGDVEVHKHDGTEVYTQQLFWNARTKKIYSNVDTKLVKGNNVFVGERFESDEDFKDWRFYYQKSRMEVNVAPGEGSDSTAVDAPAPQLVIEKAPAAEHRTTSWEPQTARHKRRVRAKGGREQMKPLALEPLEDAPLATERKEEFVPQSNQ
jgi:LPS export ABC transporter protein LptC